MFTAILTLPDKGEFVLTIGVQVPVDCVVNDVGFAPDKPLIKRLV
jgi:hypothetical protein